ncbi:phage tail protein, partial [Bacillus wiedmannii]|uniref:phage tail protein n=1 Tax=Bacillus wiedmannii TaxID=1890302 RepID=UPI002E1AD906|nr:phage tail protein [Bacillus wiedmannii]
MKRVERPKIEQLSTGDQFHLVDMNVFEVIEGKNEPSSIRFEVPDTENNKRVFEYVEDRNLLVFEGQYYILLVNKLNELGFKDCDAIQVGAELSRQTQEQKITGYLSIEEGLAHIFKGSNFKYINQCSPKNQVHFENFGGANRMSMIQNLIKRYDIECIFDNMTVIFADRIGKTTDKLYKFGYNVNAIEKTTDDSNCSFSVLLLGHTPSEEEGGGSQFQYYYESPLKYQMPELIRHRQAENIEDDKIKDKETALKRCKEAVEDIPIVSITVDHKEASFDDTNEPKVGDKAILQHHKYNMDFDVRVVKRRRYPFEQTPNVYEFSNNRDELVDRTEEQKKWTSDILSVVKELDKKLLEQSTDYTKRLNKITEEKVEEVKKESEAAKELAELVKENQKNFQTTIVESNVPPTDYLEAGKSLWLDTSKGKPGILKKWNGKTWDPIIADVEAIKNETLQQVNKDIESTKTELNQKVQEAQNQATGQYNEVTQNLQGVTRTIANVQNEQGNISKTVSQMQQTNEGFKTSIESLTKKDGEISSKLNTVESNVEGTKKTISEVQQTTSELKKTTTEVKEQAGKISEKLTSVETKVNNDKAGGRNLLLDSNVKYEKTDYLINQFTLSENFSVGEEYTFVIKGSAPQGQKFGIWQNGGSTNVGYATSAYANGITYVTFKAVATTSGNERRLNLYNYPNNATKATVEWVALYKGNKPQDWTPAPENQVTNDEFTKKTTEIEKSVDGIKESIKTVEKTQTFFDERVNTVEKNAEGTTASVKKLQETQTAQGKTISEATTTIGQHSEALKLTMKKKDVEDYVGGLGSINDLRNAAFAQGFKYWTQNGNSAVIDSSVTYRGYTTAKLHATGLTEDKWYSLHQTIDVTAGEDIVDSGYFMSNNIGQGFVLEIEYLNAQGSRVSQSSIGIDVTANSNWIRSVVSGTVPTGAVKARYKPWVRRNGTLWIALPMLQRGKVATEFWLHPKDQTDTDKMIEDIANKVATEKYNQKVTELERSISATERGVSLVSGKQETFINETYKAYVTKTESRLEVLDEGIIAQILKDGIVTAINMSPGKITINAAKLDINADTMVKWLTAKGIDTNLIRINGDKITIDKDGVTVKMLDFLFQDEWGTKTTAVSRRNLIADPDFSSVTKKN